MLNALHHRLPVFCLFLYSYAIFQIFTRSATLSLLHTVLIYERLERLADRRQLGP